MELLEIVRKLYEDGKFEEVLNAISEKYSSFDAMPDEILEVEAQSLFKFADYRKATEAAIILNDRKDPKGMELLAQLAAYVNKNDDLLGSIYEALPDNASVCNAYAIRARDEDSKIPIRYVLCAAINHINNNQIAAVHLLNNTARLLLAKGCREDIVMAIGFWQIALEKYGKKNFGHRAAVYYWLSVAYERLGAKSRALKSAKKSLMLWVKQISLDPNNPKFRENFTGAEKRVNELR